MQAASPELPLGVAPVFTLDAGPGTIRGVEAEFGIVLGKTLLPQADMPFTIAEVGAARSACCAPPPPSRSRHCLPGHCLPAQVAGAIAEVVPVIEVVGTRTKGELAANVPLLVADHVRHGLCACMGHVASVADLPLASRPSPGAGRVAIIACCCHRRNTKPLPWSGPRCQCACSSTESRLAKATVKTHSDTHSLRCVAQMCRAWLRPRVDRVHRAGAAVLVGEPLARTRTHVGEGQHRCDRHGDGHDAR